MVVVGNPPANYDPVDTFEELLERVKGEIYDCCDCTKD